LDSETTKGQGIQRVNPTTLRFSQTTAGGRRRGTALLASMREHGWNGPPVDVVETPQGLVTIDNTRVAIAQKLGMKEIPVQIHSVTEPLPREMLGRFGQAKTWGEALIHRTSNQRPPLPPSGTVTGPQIAGI
jgi:filamentous hemagglutinin